MSNTDAATTERSAEIQAKPAPQQISRLRALTDGLYRWITMGTSFMDHSPPLHNPTESQKFRANVLLAFIGTIVFGFAIYMIQEHYHHRDAEIQVNRQRLQFLHDEIQNVTRDLPKVILLTYELSKSSAALQTKPAGVADASLGPNGVTWGQVRERFESTRRAVADLPQADVLCRRLQLYMKSPEARDAVEQLRFHLTRLFDADTMSVVEDAITQTNAAWDNVVLSLIKEFEN